MDYPDHLANQTLTKDSLVHMSVDLHFVQNNPRIAIRALRKCMQHLAGFTHPPGQLRDCLCKVWICALRVLIHTLHIT